MERDVGRHGKDISSMMFGNLRDKIFLFGHYRSPLAKRSPWVLVVLIRAISQNRLSIRHWDREA